MTAGGLLSAAARLAVGFVRDKASKAAALVASLRRPPREHSTEAERVEKAREEFQERIRKRGAKRPRR